MRPTLTRRPNPNQATARCGVSRRGQELKAESEEALETGREEGLEALEEEWEEARACECLSHAADPEEVRRLRDGEDHG